ncbi:MAG TPA: YMGG-like glycine zipper-containing protein [Chthoniobacteraceae bacterium]|jgi:osmotically inducible lipoprotein OsmB|nr:YMGG-like glycine zipper-containing protein [Chthoniobacteraceae bacterium]
MKFLVPAIALSLVASMGMTGCESPAATGAVAGAGAGALTGSVFGGPRTALLGAGIGAAAGAIIGHEIGQARNDGYYDGRRLPYGRWLGHGMVASPYYPHNVIDTRGIPHGAVVQDPTTGGRFIKP